jgi:iron complex transport system permease protein
LLLVFLALNLALGSVRVPWRELAAVLASRGDAGAAARMLWEIRFPRALAGAFGGASLAASGLLLQIFFRNPIVDPFILGISSGATLAVGAVLLAGVVVGRTAVSPYLMNLAALAGAAMVLVLVVAVAGRVRNAVTLLLVGLMIGYLCSAGSSILVAVAEKEKVHAFVLWTLGSFSGFTWDEVTIVAPCASGLIGGVYLLCKPLNALLMGEDYARSLGVNLRAVRVVLVLLASSLAAIVTAFAGPVGFVGLAAPHLARLLLGTADNRHLIPAATLVGGVITSGCDLVARLILSPVELPLSAVTALFGAPLVISFLRRRRVGM